MNYRSGAVVWLDEREARIFQFSDERMSRERLRAQDAGGPEQSFPQIAQRLREAKQVVVLGTGRRGEAFFDWLRSNEPSVMLRVVACGQLDDCSDAQISSIAMAHFVARSSGGAA